MGNSEVVAIVAGDPGRPRQRGQGQGWGALAGARKEEAWASEVGLSRRKGGFGGGGGREEGASVRLGPE